MFKALVTYFSQTGNTKKIAETIFDALEGQKEILPIAEAMDIEAYDLIFVGFPVQSHSVPYGAELFLKKIPPDKRIALFSTHGSFTGSRLAREAIEHASVLASKAKIIGTFATRGKVSMKALDALIKLPEHEAWAEMAASAATHPDEHDLADARAFARWVMTMSRHHGS
jgi:flavodoxin